MGRIRWQDWKGIALAMGLMSTWALLLFCGLFVLRVESLGLWSIGYALIETLLFTGLFITAHDAMHESIAPGRPWLNRLIGRVSVLFYALFSYDRLLQEHRRHHASPASVEDPDYCEGRGGWLGWFFRFMLHYLSVWQLLGNALIGQVLVSVFHIPLVNVWAFWAAPALLSTVQLFHFGTYLPHRRSRPHGRRSGQSGITASEGYPDHHRARSNDYPVWLSFLTCYHFGYHWEHHASPTTPWWGLPALRRAGMRGASVLSS